MKAGHEVKMPTGVRFQSMTMLYFSGLNGLSPHTLAAIAKLVTSLLVTGLPHREFE
jgi:hypothetical protein